MRSNEPKASGFKPDFSALDISDEQFEKMTAITIDMVETIGLNHKSMMPHLLVHHRQIVDESGAFSDIEVTIVGIADGFGDSAEKRQILENIGAKFFAEEKVPCAIFMASEAWTSMQAAKCLDGGMMPSEDPQRKEVLMISGKTTSNDCRVGVSIPVKRDSEDKMIRDGENAVFKNKDIRMPLLNHFFKGFFGAIIHKFAPEKLQELEKQFGKTPRQ